MPADTPQARARQIAERTDLLVDPHTASPLIAYRDELEQAITRALTDARREGEEAALRALASASKRVLPPALLARVLAHFDPLTPFVDVLRQRAAAESGHTCVTGAVRAYPVESCANCSRAAAEETGK